MTEQILALSLLGESIGRELIRRLERQQAVVLRVHNSDPIVDYEQPARSRAELLFTDERRLWCDIRGNHAQDAGCRLAVSHKRRIVNQDTRTRVVTVDALTIAGMVPVKSNIIRLNRSNGRWTIVPVDKNLVKVEYILRVDPEGSVPDWLTNLFSFKGPFETFKSLRQQLKKPAYASVNLPFIID